MQQDTYVNNAEQYFHIEKEDKQIREDEKEHFPMYQLFRRS